MPTSPVQVAVQKSGSRSNPKNISSKYGYLSRLVRRYDNCDKTVPQGSAIASAA